jgi:hypothetical protein
MQLYCAHAATFAEYPNKNIGLGGGESAAGSIG